MERRPLHRHERFIGGRAEPRIAVKTPEVGLGHDCGDPVAQGDRVRAPRIDHQHRDLLVLLCSDAGEGLLKPPPGVMGHHDHHNGWGHDLFTAADNGIVCVREGLGGGIHNSHDGWRGYRSHGSISATPDYHRTMASDPLKDLAQASTDVAYIGIGVAVLAFQKFQVQRRALERAFQDHPSDPQDRLRQWIRSATDRC